MVVKRERRKKKDDEDEEAGEIGSNRLIYSID